MSIDKITPAEAMEHMSALLGMQVVHIEALRNENVKSTDPNGRQRLWQLPNIDWSVTNEWPPPPDVEPDTPGEPVECWDVNKDNIDEGYYVGPTRGGPIVVEWKNGVIAPYVHARKHHNPYRMERSE